MTAPWSESFVCAALGFEDPEGEMRQFSEISTDTRTLGPGALFLALTGDRFDGHDHLVAARDSGASGAVVRHGTPPVEGLRLYQVDDTLVALGALARRRRDTIEGPGEDVHQGDGGGRPRHAVSYPRHARQSQQLDRHPPHHSADSG